MSQTETQQQNLRLADHVRACHVDGQVILLDLRRDRYIGVGGALLPALSARIADWPLGTSATESGTSGREVDTWIDHMWQQGMLASASTATPARTTILEPQRSLAAIDEPARHGIQWRRAASIAYATFAVGHWLRRLHLAEIVVRVERLRSAEPSKPEDFSREELQGAARWYLRTRPLVMSSHDECLRDSLIMLRFLSAEGLYPRWVIGVRTRPFIAHSWVQAGSLVLNDLHETIRGYTPILVV
ncbi:lasso peptide biosynthesis B2 protein [Roseateles sp. LYH14W]|uniref:Lasso peptide biosynthesis B2 protein n=1 Tax=Pelomonas parva TaxID=3299032 RepID=A0ABW7F8Q9_9BURK